MERYLRKLFTGQSSVEVAAMTPVCVSVIRCRLRDGFAGVSSSRFVTQNRPVLEFTPERVLVMFLMFSTPLWLKWYLTSNWTLLNSPTSVSVLRNKLVFVSHRQRSVGTVLSPLSLLIFAVVFGINVYFFPLSNFLSWKRHKSIH